MYLQATALESVNAMVAGQEMTDKLFAHVSEHDYHR